jgi:hypothetical protein
MTAISNRKEYMRIEEKGTLKAAEHDKYDNIAGSV